MGRGVGRPRATPTQESPVPIVGMDCFYITKGGIRRRDQLAKGIVETIGKASFPAKDAGTGGDAISKARAAGEVLKCLLVRCFHSKNVFAHVAPHRRVMMKTTAAPSSQ